VKKIQAIRFKAALQNSFHVWLNCIKASHTAFPFQILVMRKWHRLDKRQESPILHSQSWHCASLLF